MGVRPMSMTTRPMSSMTTAPAPDPPEAAVTAEWIWLDVQAEVLATEVEEFLATERAPPHHEHAVAAIGRGRSERR